MASPVNLVSFETNTESQAVSPDSSIGSENTDLEVLEQRLSTLSLNILGIEEEPRAKSAPPPAREYTPCSSPDRSVSRKAKRRINLEHNNDSLKKAVSEGNFASIDAFVTKSRSPRLLVRSPQVSKETVSEAFKQRIENVLATGSVGFSEFKVIRALLKVGVSKETRVECLNKLVLDSSSPVGCISLILETSLSEEDRFNALKLLVRSENPCLMIAEELLKEGISEKSCALAICLLVHNPGFNNNTSKSPAFPLFKKLFSSLTYQSKLECLAYAKDQKTLLFFIRNFVKTESKNSISDSLYAEIMNRNGSFLKLALTLNKQTSRDALFQLLTSESNKNIDLILEIGGLKLSKKVKKAFLNRKIS
ncbi:MAG: hypothetical protein S4CHLAM7_06640 [Chlamydiae bacterium]|nr:hypothetical protein [Chlamydiota bacterium]